MTGQGKVYINGRFSTQRFSGVQRFSIEITTALQELTAQRARLLVPPNTTSPPLGAMKVGRLKGQAWEQADLPRFAADGLLLNLGNSAPLLARRQVVVIHDTGVFSTPEAYSRKFRLWYKFLHSSLVSRRTPIVTVSEFSRREIVRHLKVNPERVSVIPEGADHIGRIQADERILDSYNLRHRRFVLVVGNLAAHKNLRALNILAERVAAQDIPLVITGGLSGAAFQAAAKSALPKPALCVGRISDEELKALYKAASCFVFPSRYEGFGLPVGEAMACGCPVVAADIPAVRERFGSAVQFCDPVSADDIAKQVCDVLDSAALQARLRHAGLELTGAMTWKRAAESLNNLLSDYGGVSC